MSDTIISSIPISQRVLNNGTLQYSVGDHIRCGQSFHVSSGGLLTGRLILIVARISSL